MQKNLSWEPAVYEHKAALIGRSVADVAGSSELLTQAMLAEYETYHSDFLTLGLDLYNIEAEACGAKVTALSPEACPEIQTPPWNLDALPELRLPDITTAARFPLITQAGLATAKALGASARLRVGVSGPVSIAAKLVGMENLIVAAACQEAPALQLLAFCRGLSLAWIGYLRGRGLDVIIFDSAASPPNFSPDLYRSIALPLHRDILAFLAGTRQSDRPLIMGGDTTPIVADLCHTGATTLVCDYPAHAHAFAAAIPPGISPTIRRNISPQSLLDGSANPAAFARDLRTFPSPIAGTGILPYRFPPSLLLNFRQQVTSAL